MNFKLSVILFAVLLFQGCAVSNVSKNYQLNKSSNEGLVFLTLTVDGVISDYSLTFGTPTKREFVKFAYGTPASLFETKDIDSKDAKGKLFAIKMPAGKYKVFRWGVNSGSYNNSSSEPIDIEFNVDAGKVVYIGNYHFDSAKSTAMWQVDANVFHINAYHRDSQLFLDKYPSISKNSIIKAFEDDFRFNQIGGSTSHTPTESLIFIP
ncbi:hypothetical protein [Kangiella sp. HZ709]|uniref:hypothetical protein n=1 Tax=Kangiella sp. HZ709 TaxID=2666328 RepID=UPI0012AFBA68|nr:hypothetical protein [Kangiella sp. HZ709]MRX27433.1 hypothetical protein [Kangiella sp. HZ709]